jgi:uncharacterized Fe-S cluster protein YjdI
MYHILELKTGRKMAICSHDQRKERGNSNVKKKKTPSISPDPPLPKAATLDTM